jgi:hypothetical protein
MHNRYIIKLKKNGGGGATKPSSSMILVNVSLGLFDVHHILVVWTAQIFNTATVISEGMLDLYLNVTLLRLKWI